MIATQAVLSCKGFKRNDEEGRRSRYVGKGSTKFSMGRHSREKKLSGSVFLMTVGMYSRNGKGRGSVKESFEHNRQGERTKRDQGDCLKLL